MWDAECVLEGAEENPHFLRKHRTMLEIKSINLKLNNGVHCMAVKSYLLVDLVGNAQGMKDAPFSLYIGVPFKRELTGGMGGVC